MNKLSYALILFIAVACGGNSFQTESGITVSYLRKGEGDRPVDSLVSMFKMRYTTEEGEVLMESEEPMALKIDPDSQTEQGEFFNVLRQLRIGDSVGFDLVASELFAKTFRAPLPDSIAGDSKIKFQCAYTDQLTETGYYNMIAEKAEKAAEKQLIIDTEIIDNHLKDNQIEAITTESGLRYVIKEEGIGPKPDSGQIVKVNYAGRILAGDYFDSNIEEIAREKGIFQEGRSYGPFTFPLETGRVIKGWDEAISLLNIGTKATLYIPSPLGYGTRSTGAIIKPNSILVFDVELLGIEEE